jgi:hypothetical protein
MKKPKLKANPRHIIEHLDGEECRTVADLLVACERAHFHPDDVLVDSKGAWVWSCTDEDRKRYNEERELYDAYASTEAGRAELAEAERAAALKDKRAHACEAFYRVRYDLTEAQCDAIEALLAGGA